MDFIFCEFIGYNVLVIDLINIVLFDDLYYLKGMIKEV